jgi:SHS2 domain-containing protein
LVIEYWSKKSYGWVERNRMSEKYKLIDHTADFGIQVFGSDSQALFTNAALALFDVITEMDALKGDDSCNITVSGEDWADLMINWLREILYLWNGKEMLVKSVQILSLSENKISAKIYFDAYLPDRHTIKTEIKAVTYHQIQVKRSPTGWKAQIIFDI